MTNINIHDDANNLRWIIWWAVQTVRHHRKHRPLNLKTEINQNNALHFITTANHYLQISLSYSLSFLFSYFLFLFTVRPLQKITMIWFLIWLEVWVLHSTPSDKMLNVNAKWKISPVRDWWLTPPKSEHVYVYSRYFLYLSKSCQKQKPLFPWFFSQ